MKKRYKLLAVFVAVVLVVCCCCIPASAATINAGTGSLVYVGDTNAGPVINGNQNSDGSYWINYYAGRTDWCLGLLYPVDILIDRGDIVSWSSFYVSFYISLSSTMTDSVCLGFMDENYKFYKLEEEYFYGTTAYGSFGEQFDGGQLQFNEDVNVKYICIMLYGYYGQTSAGTFGWQPYTFKLSNTDENSIMLEGMISEQQKTNEFLGDITADQYAPPSGQDQMDELSKQEEVVNQNAQEGMNEAGNMFKAFSLDFFTDGLGAIVQIYNRIIPKIPWLNQLITISLALGLFSFLVGAAQAYIGRLNANDRKAQREQARRGK